VYDGRAALEMILAVYESHRLNAPVELPLKNRRHPLSMLCAGFTNRGVWKLKKEVELSKAKWLVEPPLIEECAGHLECKVVETFKIQTHDLLICEVLRAVADSDLFDDGWIPEKFHTLHYLYGNKYGLLQRTVKAVRATQRFHPL